MFALDEQEHPFHKELRALAVHAGGWPGLTISSSLRALKMARGAAISAAQSHRIFLRTCTEQ